MFSRALALADLRGCQPGSGDHHPVYDITNLAGATQSTFTEPFYTARLNSGVGDILTGYSDVNSWYNSMVITSARA